MSLLSTISTLMVPLWYTLDLGETIPKVGPAEEYCALVRLMPLNVGRMENSVTAISIAAAIFLLKRYQMLLA